MKAKFSEFSYGFALTHELVRGSGGVLAAAPEFPSLFDEGKAGGGYDVKLVRGRPLLLQFKLSEYMKGVKSNLSEQDCFQLPYFRFDVRPRIESNQHKLLLDWERRGKLVYYAAPAFWQTTELNTYFFNEKIAQKTVFVRPSSIGPLPDDNKHRIVFSPNHSYGCFCSEPQDVQVVWGSEALVADFTRPGTARSSDIDEAFFRRVGDEIVEMISERSNTSNRFQYILTDASPLERAALLARTMLNSELMVVIDRGQVERT